VGSDSGADQKLLDKRASLASIAEIQQLYGSPHAKRTLQVFPKGH
jgi:hypothetical protein